MTPQAHVTSIETIDQFRARLIVYLEKAAVAVDDLVDQAGRHRRWLQEDRRIHWETQVRRRTQALEAARQELFSTRIGNLREAAADKKMAVARAKRALEEAAEKLEAVKRWLRHYDNEVGPQVKQLEKLRDYLAVEMGGAVTVLTHSVDALDAYSGRGPAAPSFSPTQPEATAPQTAPAAADAEHAHQPDAAAAAERAGDGR
jgi:hypothetical protein